jgi:hypothetical protein
VAERIQLSRAAGWRKPEGAVVVSRPSKWGNPWSVGAVAEVSTLGPDGWLCAEMPVTAAMAVEAFRQAMVGRLTVFDPLDPDDVAYVQGWRAALGELAGRDLACWCPLDAPCHADVLLELANA